MKRINELILWLALILFPLSFLQAQLDIDFVSLKYNIWDFLDNNELESAIHYSDSAINILKTEKDSIIFTFYQLKAEAYEKKNEPDIAMEILRESIGNAKIKYNVNLSLADNYAYLGTLLLKKNRSKEALDYFEKAKPIYEKYSEYLSIAEIWNNAGMILHDKFEYELSIEKYEAAIESLNKLGEQEDRDAILSLKTTFKHNIGVSYTGLGREKNDTSYFNAADDYLQEAKRNREDQEDSSVLGSTLIALADNQLMKDGNIILAKSFLDDAEGMISDSSKIATYYLVKGRIAEAEGRRDKAREYYEQSKDIAGKIGNGENIEAYYAYMALIELKVLTKEEEQLYWSKIGKIKGKKGSLTGRVSALIRIITKPEERRDISRGSWLITSFVGLFMSILLMLVFIRKASTITAYNLAAKYYYLLLIPASLSSAAFLFGAMKSYAVFIGTVLRGELELAGPVVIFVGMMYFGLKYGRNEETVDFTVLLFSHTRDLKSIQGEISMDVGHERKTEVITNKSSVDFKNIPGRYRTKNVILEIQAEGWVFINGNTIRKCKLKDDHIRLEIKEKKNEKQ
jgi:tetratricopeptide (TPR) repeat protein